MVLNLTICEFRRAGAKANTAKIASYNLWNKMWWWDVRKYAVAAMIREADATVVGFEEVLRSAGQTSPMGEGQSSFMSMMANLSPAAIVTSLGFAPRHGRTDQLRDLQELLPEHVTLSRHTPAVG
jgi:hypothetical protein